MTPSYSSADGAKETPMDVLIQFWAPILSILATFGLITGIIWSVTHTLCPAAVPTPIGIIHDIKSRWHMPLFDSKPE